MLFRSGTQKVVLKEFVTAAIILVPPAAEAIAKLWAYFGSKQKERDEVIKTLEQKKISPWGNINVYYAFDWATETFLAQEDVTDEVLKKGSVLVYVNKWAVKRNPGAVLIGEKQAPDGLSGSYLLYTGKIEAIKQFADSKL